MTTFFVLDTLGQYCNTGGMAASLARWLDHRACNEAKHHSEKLSIKPSAFTLLHLSGFTGRITDKKKSIVLEAVRCAGILHPLIHQTESPDFTQKHFLCYPATPISPLPHWLLCLTFALNVVVGAQVRCMFDGKFSDSVWLVCRLCCETIQHGGRQSRDWVAVT